jgi:hypothetical protein
LGIIVVILGFTQGDFLLLTSPVSADKKNTVEITLFNWNTQCWDQGKDEIEFYHYLEKQKADIYLLQEYLHLRDWENEENNESRRF